MSPVRALCCLLFLGSAPSLAMPQPPDDPVGPEVQSAAEAGETPGQLIAHFDGMRHIARVAFDGNRVTRERTLMRELPFRAGDQVHLATLREGEQRLLDLNLFRSVHREMHQLPDGSISVTYVLRERWFVLPTPHIDASSDGTFGGGVGVSWSNFLGLNHDLSVLAIYRSFDERDRNNELLTRARYDWRRVADSRFNLQFFGAYRQEETRFGGELFDERTQDAAFSLSRQLTSERTGQGWVARAGLSWRRSVNSGAAAPPDDGVLTAFNAGISHREVRSRLYSEVGSFVGFGLSADIPMWSDYHQFSWRADAARLMAAGQRAHQNLNLRASFGSRHGGPELRRREAFSLGGARSLRGYPNEFAEGDYFWLLSAEFLRPLRWNWLRALLVLETGNAGRTNLRPREESVLVSLGAGFRVRVIRFVNLEIEAGVAVPLNGGDGLRVFAAGL